MNIRTLCTIVVIAMNLTACNKIENFVPNPQTRQINMNQAELISAFAGLTDGDESACNIVFETADIPGILCDIVSEAQVGSEIVFLIDHTGSMDDDIDEVKRNINKIIDCLPDNEFMRLGAATYGDRFEDGQNWFDWTPLTNDYDAIRSYVNSIYVRGGGDIPESVYDGIYETLDQMNWQDCTAPDKIIVMGDAPPKTGGGTFYSLEQVLDKAQSICPDTEFYPVIVMEL